MRFFEFKPPKPLTPEQSRIAALKRNADNARMALKRERESQTRNKALKQLSQLRNIS